MTIEAIGGIAGRAELDPAAIVGRGEGLTASHIYKEMVAALEELNGRMAAGRAGLEQLAQGDMDNLHQLMIGMERTRLSFDLLMSVRNRVLEAYQEIMRMQV